MSKDKNIERWIFASICKHFDARKETLPLFIEGMHRDRIINQDQLELRIDGPYIVEESHNLFYYDYEINILVSSVINDTDLHQIYRDVGIVTSAFVDIEVYKYGTGVDDDQSLLGCLRLKQSSGNREKIQVSNFGQIEPDVKLLQATVEGHYRLTLSL